MTELPPPTSEVARLVSIIGPMATLALVEARGGTRLYVPSPVNPDGDLARIVGVDAAQALADHYGREQIAVPVGRRWRIIAYRERGMSYAAIARATGCHERTVYRILDDEDLVRRQLSLFPDP